MTGVLIFGGFFLGALYAVARVHVPSVRGWRAPNREKGIRL